MPDHDGGADEAIGRRRRRFAVVAAVSSALVAVGVTGTGLLLPGGGSAPLVRIVAVVVAVAAGGLLVRADGPARSATMLALVGTVGAIVCLSTFPASPVSLRIGPDTLPFTPPGTVDDGAGAVGDDRVVIGPGVPDRGRVATMAVPDGFDIVVQDGRVTAVGPDGTTTLLGSVVADATFGRLGRDGTTLVPDETGTLRRDDGGPLGPAVALGGVTFERPDGRRAVVGPRGTLEVPEPIETETTEPTEDLDALLALLLAAFALLAFSPPILRLGERIGVRLVDEPDDEPDAAPDPEAESGQSGSIEDELSGVLAAMLADPDPRTSVIGAYARLLDALAATGFPRRTQEGPHEHLWRILGPLGVRRQPVHQLAELFVRARFTPRPVTETHRQAAITALADAIADLRLRDDAIDDEDVRVLVEQVVGQ